MKTEGDQGKKVPESLRVQGCGQRPLVHHRTVNQMKAGDRKRLHCPKGAQDLGETSQMRVADKVHSATRKLTGCKEREKPFPSRKKRRENPARSLHNQRMLKRQRPDFPPNDTGVDGYPGPCCCGHWINRVRKFEHPFEGRIGETGHLPASGRVAA
jgi:hypothetical protein